MGGGRRGFGRDEFPVDVEAELGTVIGRRDMDPGVVADGFASPDRCLRTFAFADEAFGLTFFAGADADPEDAFAARFPDDDRVFVEPAVRPTPMPPG